MATFNSADNNQCNLTDNKPKHLWLALRFYDLPLSVQPYDTSKPTIITERGLVVCANTVAHNCNIHLGMSSASAHALTTCVELNRHADQEQALLHTLTQTLYGFTPYIQTYQPNSKNTHSACTQGLLLELSRCLKLFKGLQNLTHNIFNTLTPLITHYAYGLAHTANAAWLLSFQSQDITGKETVKHFHDCLKTIPIEYLHDHPKPVAALQKMGFKALDDVMMHLETIGIAPFKRRLGQDFAHMLCQLFDMEHHLRQAKLIHAPVPTYTPNNHFCKHYDLEYPAQNIEGVLPVMEVALQQLERFLQIHQRHIQKLRWRFFDIYKNKHDILINNTQANDATWLLTLTRLQLEQNGLPFAVDHIELTGTRTVPLKAQTLTFNFDQPKSHTGLAQDLALTEAKIKARLGEHGLHKVSYQPSHIPEQTHQRIPINQSANQSLAVDHTVALRPHWLFKTPIAITHKHHTLYWRGKLTLIHGPERIESHWWDTPTSRDYYLALRTDHTRLWIFCDIAQRQWYAHGVF